MSLPSHPRPTAWRSALAGLALTVAATNALAQDELSPAPPEPLVPSLLRDSAPPPPESQPSGPIGPLFQYGPFILHPSLAYRYAYGLGLPAADGRRVASEIHTVAPTVELDAGPHWSVAYAPSWVFYTARALKDTVGQSLRLSAAGDLEGWASQLSESYVIATPILAETAQQTQQTIWTTQAGASRAFTTRTQFDIGGSMSENLGDTSHSARDWSATSGLTYRISDRLNTGLSFGFGYSEIANAPDTYNESYSGRLGWNPTDRINLGMSVGEEVRQSWAAAIPATTSPLLSFSLGYQPFAVTSLNLSGSRSISNSFVTGQAVIGRSWSASLSQRLLAHYFLNAAYANQDTDYGVSAFTAPNGRTDRHDSFNVGLTTQLLGHWTVAASYQHTRNRSSQPGFNFATTQYGLEFSCRY